MSWYDTMVELGYEICKLLEGDKKYNGAQQIANALDEKVGIVRHGLRFVRRGRCPPYHIPYVPSNGTRQHYTVINQSETGPIPDQLTADGGVESQHYKATKYCQHIILTNTLLAEREVNPIKKMEYMSKAASHQVAYNILIA
jgi:hypothetical protein